jgi:hypothetical protein
MLNNKDRFGLAAMRGMVPQRSISLLVTVAASGRGPVTVMRGSNVNGLLRGDKT